MNSTILGASGFIGSHLVSTLKNRGLQCWTPDRDDPEIFKRSLGCVYYCIGLTADFRTRPFDTVKAHVEILRKVLEYANFDQLIYLSSTRVYTECSLAEETQKLTVAPYLRDELYNLSKLMGESLALSSGRACRVARLSNVLGFDMGSTNFIGALLAEAHKSGAVHFRTSMESTKDYIWIDDAVTGLISIAEQGRQPIYNVAGGVNVHHESIAKLLAQKGIHITVDESAPTTTFPVITIEKLVSDTGFQPGSILPKLSELLDTEFGFNSPYPSPCC
jgi:nucleoside-diphosphate-sugar epimerase